MSYYSNLSPLELANLFTRKIMRYTELLRKEGRKTIDANEQEEYLRLKSELLALHELMQVKNEKV